ncbi:enoyl-CoA hydratase [Corynebacterium epidermidicanis]|uniref:Enoyl-CoA hydratase/carnithine racemase n=1 Tax=Corynebacterium epidermidicanis TaxID=1050174 RepID=A0A0G3GPZ9_9CORY|nr:enoyl-CoA hydratase [Corynebacterium epidermidicanis]AKK02620.1 enoyl-CoA hydratase/carnithine racemase [Corynebacterium epidermidicanis]
MVLRYEQQDHLAILTLNRPEKRNALNLELTTALADELRTLSSRGPDHTRAVLIRGEGAAFCAGADFSGVYNEEFLGSLQRMLTAILEAPVPVIADIQGPAVGAGVQVALACDLRVVGDNAWFLVPPAKLGFALDNWTIRRAASMLGGSVARGVLLGVQKVSADLAGQLGFANERGDADAALQYAQTIASYAPLSVQQLKRVLNDEGFGFALSATQQQMYEAAWSSQDAQEAIKARAEKRAPEFRGR